MFDFDINSIRWFDGITEIVPSDLDDMDRVIDKATSYVIIEPVAAKALLRELNETLGEEFDTENLEPGTTFSWDFGTEYFFRLDHEVLYLIQLQNALATLTETATVHPRRFRYDIA